MKIRQTMKKLLAFFLLLALPFCALCEDYAFYSFDGQVLFAPSVGDEQLEAVILGVGESVIIKADGVNNVVFASSDEGVVNVDSDGIALAVSVGEAVISAQTPDGATTEIAARVLNAPTGVKLSDRKGAMHAGDTYQLTYTLSGKSAGAVEWQSSDEEVVYVDSNGLLTANGAGECTISIETYNGLTDECAVTVTMPAPAKVTLPSKGGHMCVGETYALEATLKGGFRETVSWTSSDETVLSVDSYGILTALSEGISVVRAQASGGGYAECTVTVLAGSTDIDITPERIVMYAGGEMKLAVGVTGGSGKKTVLSDDERVVSVNEKGDTLFAHSSGTAIISAYTPNGVADERMAVVLERPEPFALTARTSAIAVSETVKLSFASDEPISLPITYKSSDTKIAKVDAFGNVTGVKVGTATITATAGGASTQYDVSVMKLATGISLESTTGVMGVGDRYTLKYTLSGGAGSPTFTSSAQGIVQVNPETGELLALSEGTATITCKLKNGRSAKCEVRVSPAPTKIEIVESGIVMGAGDKIQLHYEIDDAARGSVIWSSENAQLMKVDSSGMAVSVGGAGHVEIKATTHNNLTAGIKIDILPPPQTVELTAFALEEGSPFDYYLIMKKGETRTLNANCPMYTSVTIDYSSSQPNVAEVSSDGTISAVSKGTTLITARTYSGAQATVLVEVE